MANGLSHSEASPPCKSRCHWPQLESSSTSRCAITKLTVPCALPGKMRLRFCPSSGLAKVSAASKPGTLTTNTKPIEPRSCRGSIEWNERMAASMPTYSVPWTPDVMESLGPSLAPLINPTGRRRLRCSAWDLLSRDWLGQASHAPLQAIDTGLDLFLTETEADAHVALAMAAVLEAGCNRNAAFAQNVL